MKNLLLIFVFFLTQQESLIIKNVENNHVNVVLTNLDKDDLIIMDKFKYTFYIYNSQQKIDYSTFDANQFYILIEYSDTKPTLKFFSVSNNYSEISEKVGDSNKLFLKYNESFNFKFPLEKYTESDVYKHYYQSGTAFFDYIAFTKNSKYKIQILYKNQNNCKIKIFKSNIVNIKT